MRRHFETAELNETKAAGRPVGGIQFIDADFGSVCVAADIGEQIAQQTIDEPRCVLSGVIRAGDLRERYFEFE
jgi:hypothetical protein